MRSRPLSFLITLLWLAWACLIVPGHTRGLIAVDGTVARTTSGESIAMFFSSLPSCCQSQQEPGSKSPPSSSNCLICKTVGDTGIAPALTLIPAPSLYVETLPPYHDAQVRCIAFLPTFQGRAPPAFSL